MFSVFPEQFRGTARPDLKWTELPNRNEKIKLADLPWPIVVAIQRYNPKDEERDQDYNDPVWEFTLSEFGTWNWGFGRKSQGAFTPIRWLGTRMEKGKPSYKLEDGKMECWEGFDNAGYLTRICLSR